MGQGNGFTPVCHSVHWWGVYPSMQLARGVCLWGCTPPWTHTRPRQTPPRQTTPGHIPRTPPGRHPLGRHPPDHSPPLSSWPLKMAVPSYWNAFLLILILISGPLHHTELLFSVVIDGETGEGNSRRFPARVGRSYRGITADPRSDPLGFKPDSFRH